MANPRIEEVDDDEDIGDPEEMDLDSFDFAAPKGTLGQSSIDAASSRMSAEAVQAMLQPQNQSSTAGAPQMSEKERERIAREQREKSKNYQCIYPVYFDATRSREDGRRVKIEDAIENPLAREIVEALHHIGNSLSVPLQIVFEPSKCHPKDWANPGRVRVQVKQEGRAVNTKIQNKHYMNKLISAYLKSHPTTPESPLKLRITGLPAPPKESLQPPAVPRGFKMGTILPLHSPAMSGGGVSDNFLKDVMQEMQEGGGQLPEGMQGMANMMNSMAGGGGGGGPRKPQKIHVKRK